MILCRNLERRFGDVVAVAGLSLDVPQGGICVVLGPNGAGKSTTLKMLSGLLAPTGGDAWIDGVSIRQDSGPLRRRIGCMPEDLGLFGDLTVEEHLALTGAVFGVERGETEVRANQLIGALGLENGRSTFARSCSHGMRKKTALAMALLPAPNVLILDEPFEAIEPATVHVIGELLRSAAGRGVTVLLSSHVLATTARIASQIVILREGKVTWNSAAQELPCPLDDLYFRTVGTPVFEDLAWLGRPS